MTKLQWHRNNNKQDGLRGFVTYYKRDKGWDPHFQYQILWRKSEIKRPSFSIHFGNRGSETPIDLIFSFAGLGQYYGLNFPGGGQFCEWLGQGYKRNISLKVHGGHLWWELWYDDDGGYDDHHKCDSRRKPKLWPWSMGSDKHRGWMCLRNGNIELNPLDAFWGHRYYSHKDIETKTALVPVGQFEGDEYEVIFTLQSQTRARAHGPAWVRHVSDEGYSAAWKCSPGLPVRNHDWKGDEILASAEKVTSREDWLAQAVVSLIARVRGDRIHHNYHPPRETSEL